MKKLILMLVCLILQGCVSINKLSPDTYQLTNGSGLITGGLVNGLAEANAFCANRNKEIVVQLYQLNQVIFQCLNHNDRDLKMIHYRPAPDIIIRNEFG